MGIFCMTPGPQTGVLWQPKKVGWGGGGRVVQEEGDIYILMADACWYIAETNTVQ